MIAEPESKEWSNQQNIEAAKRFKEEGNKHFVGKEYKQALKAYHKAFLHLGGIVDSGSAMSAYSKKVASTQLTEQANYLRFSISLNMAQIYIFQQKYDRGLDILTKASKIKTNAKLYYRRGICLMRLSEFQKAKEDLSKVADLDPTMRAQILKLNEQMKSLQKRQDQKSKDMFKKFFK